MTLPSATQFPAISFKRGVTDKVYPDHSALLWDIVEIMKKELARLAAEGVATFRSTRRATATTWIRNGATGFAPR